MFIRPLELCLHLDSPQLHIVPIRTLPSPRIPRLPSPNPTRHLIPIFRDQARISQTLFTTPFLPKSMKRVLRSCFVESAAFLAPEAARTTDCFQIRGSRRLDGRRGAGEA